MALYQKIPMENKKSNPFKTLVSLKGKGIVANFYGFKFSEWRISKLSSNKLWGQQTFTIRMESFANSSAKLKQTYIYIYIHMYVCIWNHPEPGLSIPLSLDMKSQVRQTLHKKNKYPKSLGRWNGKKIFFFVSAAVQRHQYWTFPPFPPHYIYIHTHIYIHIF